MNDQSYSDYLSPGDYLKHKRLQEELSVETVAQETFLPEKTIKAIEAWFFDFFIPKVNLEGLVVSYAEYLGCDGEELIRQFPASLDYASNDQIGVKPYRKIHTKNIVLTSLIAKILIGICGIFVVAYLLQQVGSLRNGAELRLENFQSGTIIETDNPIFVIKGTIGDEDVLFVNEKLIDGVSGSEFSEIYHLQKGLNQIRVTSVGSSGGTETKVLEVVRL